MCCTLCQETGLWRAFGPSVSTELSLRPKAQPGRSGHTQLLGCRLINSQRLGVNDHLVILTRAL
jgi:hypothetical protein